MLFNDIPIENFDGIGWRCRLGGYHDRHVVFGEPASNNLWIYTAIADALGLPVDIEQLIQTLFNCNYTSQDTFWILNRLPLKIYPPISRDEWIGIFCLMGQIGEGYIYRIANNEWTWLRDPELFDNYSTLETLQAFWRAIGKHRNYLWKEEELATYKWLFSFRGHDRYFFKEAMGLETTWSERAQWTLYKYWTNWKGSPGEKNILWLQCRRLKDNFIEKIDYETNIKLYFPVNHIFTLVLTDNN